MIKNVNGVEVEMTDAEVAEYNALQADTAEKRAQEVIISSRAERDRLLVENVDPVVCNPFRWEALTAEKQAEWAAYRTALLDITDQAGFPTDITWPTKPE